MIMKWIFCGTHLECLDRNRDEGTSERQVLSESDGNVKGGGGDPGAWAHDVEDGLVPCIDGEDASCGDEEDCANTDILDDASCCGHGGDVC